MLRPTTKLALTLSLAAVMAAGSAIAQSAAPASITIPVPATDPDIQGKIAELLKDPEVKNVMNQKRDETIKAQAAKKPLQARMMADDMMPAAMKNIMKGQILPVQMDSMSKPENPQGLPQQIAPKPF